MFFVTVLFGSDNTAVADLAVVFALSVNFGVLCLSKSVTAVLSVPVTLFSETDLISVGNFAGITPLPSIANSLSSLKKSETDDCVFKFCPSDLVDMARLGNVSTPLVSLLIALAFTANTAVKRKVNKPDFLIIATQT